MWTVQDLIDALERVEDKSKIVLAAAADGAMTVDGLSSAYVEGKNRTPKGTWGLFPILELDSYIPFWMEEIKEDGYEAIPVIVIG
jgi:hypothetical protein